MIQLSTPFQKQSNAPKLGPADLQSKKLQETFAKQNVQRADSARLAAVEHGLADADRRRHTENRDAFVTERKLAAKPLSHGELRVLDAQVEFRLAKNVSFERNPGEPIILGDGTRALSKQAYRVKTAERNLQSAVDANERARLMLRHLQHSRHTRTMRLVQTFAATLTIRST